LQQHFPTTILLQNLSTSLYTYLSLSLYAGGVHEKKNQKQEWRKMGRRFRLSQPNNPPRRSFRFLKTIQQQQGNFFFCKEKKKQERERQRGTEERDGNGGGGDGASTSAKELQRMRGAREEEERL
jgi:hypothetical protein